MRDHTIALYKFDELPTDAAKKTARNWMREFAGEDGFGAKCTLDDAKEALKALGYSVENIYYSGFSSQGDGACFTGNFYASDYDSKGTNGVQKLLIDRPADKELARCAAELERILLACPELSASISHFGHYSHEMSTRFSVDFGDEDFSPGKEFDTQEIEDAFKEVSRDLMRWIYKALETDYEYRMSDEAIEEDIRANEYEFTEEGGIP
jgi:hypothetical protein